MADKVNKLTLNRIKQEKSKLNKMKAITVITKTGASYHLDVTQYITNEQIDQAYSDLAQFFSFMADLELDTNDNTLSAVAQPYLCLCLIGAISSLKLPESVPDRVAVARDFYNLEIFDSIFDKMDKEEVENAINKLKTLLETYTKGVNELRVQLNEQVKEIERQEQVMWEVDEKIAQINEIAYEDNAHEDMADDTKVVNITDHKKD